MRLLKYSFCLLLLLCTNSSHAQLQHLRVSDNKRFLVKQDGSPFFWLADTGWELFHRLNKTDATNYFKQRAAQGFTVIQAVALAELDGLHTPNANGDLPLIDDDPAKPNAAYFGYIDTLIGIAESYHLYIALLPTWGDKLYKNSWGKGPEIFSVDNAYTYGLFIGKLFKKHPNIIWIVGGDRSPRENTTDVATWRNMAKGINTGAGNTDDVLMSFHPQPDGASSSSAWFQQDDWLDFNMLQTGHCRDTPVWEMVSDNYARLPVKPVVNGENIYEEMPVCFNPKELGYASAYDVRKAAYGSVFAGAFGHTYGCGPVIWFSETTDHLFAVFHTWRTALDLPAANEMKYLRALMESRPFTERKPDQGLLAVDAGPPAEHIQATSGNDYAFIYSAYGRTITIKPYKITGDSLSANWFNPRTGITRFIGVFANKSQLSFMPPLPIASPVPSQKEDWVLILDNAAKNYPMPSVLSFSSNIL